MTEEPQDPSIKELNAYFRSSESWAADQQANQRSTVRLAWIVATVLGTVAVAEAVALVVMMPLKTVEPYTLLVDKQTGFVEALKPLERETIAPDRALTRSFVAQYVLAREGFDLSSVRSDYRKVALWSAGEARDRYVADMQATNPASPLARLPRGTMIDVEVRGMSTLTNDTALVRFSTIRTDPGGQPQPAQPWQAVVTWRFSGSAMSEADRLTNPLGFQVVRYRHNAEIPMGEAPAVATPSPGNPTVAAPLPSRQSALPASAAPSVAAPRPAVTP
jgi:type IV secretion system protein VirB8